MHSHRLDKEKHRKSTKLNLTEKYLTRAAYSKQISSLLELENSLKVESNQYIIWL